MGNFVICMYTIYCDMCDYCTQKKLVLATSYLWAWTFLVCLQVGIPLEVTIVRKPYKTQNF